MRSTIRINAVAILVLTYSFSFNVKAACNYKIAKESAKLTWTGYKFTDKKAVPGTFDKIEFKQKDSTSLKALLESISFKIDTKSLNSGNPARDATLKATVFNFLRVPNEISGEIIEHNENSSKVMLTINQETSVDFKTSIDDERLIAKGSIDLMNNGLKPNFEAVHTSCEKLHTGEDGLSKTWSTVDLQIEAKIVKTCSLMDKFKGYFSKN